MFKPLKKSSINTRLDNQDDIARSQYSFSEEVSHYAAFLAIIEIGLGSVLHAVKIPFGGHFLSMNQAWILSHMVGATKQGKVSACLAVSNISAILKSLSPAGNKLGPMLSISVQGFLYALGLGFFGYNTLGIIVATCLLCLWAFVLPVIMIYFFYGHTLIEGYFFYLKKAQNIWNFESETVLAVVLAVFLIKCIFASVLSVKFFRYPQAAQLYFEGLKKYRPKKEKPDTRIISVDQYRNKDIAKLALKDMFKPLFIVSFILMVLFFVFAQNSWSKTIWLSLRPVAIAFIFFFVSRHPYPYKKMRQHKDKKFFVLLDKTLGKINRYEEK